MSLFNAIYKSFLDLLNSAKLKKDNAKAHKQAYQQTGKEINVAKRQGRTINGSKRFKVNLKKKTKKNKENYKIREKFIDRL